MAMRHGKNGSSELSLYKSKILVTGGTGLLGSHFSQHLIDNECHFETLSLNDEYVKDYKDKFSDVNLNLFDISEYKELDSFISKNNFDIIFHFAAQTQVGDALKNPLRTFKSNIEGTWNLLEICRNKKIPIVIASSDKAYGVSDKLPYKEDFELKGEFPYEVSKSVTDLLSNTYKKTYNQNLVTLRCGNIYGGGDLNWERLIPGVIKWLLENKTPVLRSDGSYVRDWVYVDDVVDAYIEVGKAILEKPANNYSYNFSSQDNYSVMYVYEKLCNMVHGKYVEPIFDISSEKEIPSQFLDSSLIKNDLNIEAKVKLEEGLEKTINWYKEYLKL